MNESKLLLQFLLFAALVLIIVAAGKMVAGMFSSSLPGPLYSVLSGGAPQEKPPLAEVHGA